MFNILNTQEYTVKQLAKYTMHTQNLNFLIDTRKYIH